METPDMQTSTVESDKGIIYEAEVVLGVMN